MSGSVLVQQRATAAGSAIRVPKNATPKIVARKVSKLYPTPGSRKDFTTVPTDST